MIHASWYLQRDPAFTASSIDGRRELDLSLLNNPNGSGLWGGHLALGAAATFAAFPAILKTVEDCPVGDGWNFTGTIERLWAAPVGGLKPFKARFIYPNQFSADNAIFIKHTERVLDLLPTWTDRPLEGFVDPISASLATAFAYALENSQPHTGAFIERLSGVMDMQTALPATMWGIADDVYTPSAVATQLSRISMLGYGLQSPWSGESYHQFVSEIISPAFQMVDPVTVEVLTHPKKTLINTAVIATQPPHMDLSPPLQPADGGIILLTPTHYAAVAQHINNARISDYVLEWSTFDDASAVKPIYWYDRYASNDTHVDMQGSRLRRSPQAFWLLIKQAVTQALSIDLPPALVREPLIVRVAKTINEEAVIYVRHQMTGTPVLTVHVDIALMSLVSAGLSSSPS